MNMGLSELLGWVGAGLLVLAYFLNSGNKLSSDSKLYQVLNVSGALFVGQQTYMQAAFSALAVNVVWMIIGLHALFRLMRK